jgi:hypothetical protein
MNLEGELSRDDVWGFYVSLASIILSLLGIFTSAIFPCTEFEGSICRVESILVWLTGTMWSIASITSIVGSHKDESSVIDESYLVVHPNLYFFSLCCLITSILLIASWFQENIHSGNSLTTTQWILLGSMSFFVTISGIAFRDEAESKYVEMDISSSSTITTTNNNSTGPTSTSIPLCDLEDYNCYRVNLAIILGSVSAAIACIVIPWRGYSPKCHVDVSAMLFVAWFVSVWYLTFDSGPGRAFGNIYFGTWAALYLSLNILILSSTMDETTMNLASSGSRASSRIRRDDVWEVAYGRLDMLTPRHYSNRRENDGELFFSPEEWPGMDTSGFMDDGGEEQERAYALSKDAKIRSYQIQQLEMWSILGIASAINLTAMVDTFEEIDEKEIADRYILCVPSMSIIFAVLGFSTCLRNSISAKRIQVAMVRKADTRNLSRACICCG